MIAIRFRLRRKGSLAELTEGRAGVRLETWCNFVSDLVRVAAPDRHTQALVLEQVFARSMQRRTSMLSEGAHAFVRCHSRRDRSVTALVERHGGMVLPPIVSSGGWDEFRVCMVSSRDMSRLFAGLRELGAFEIISKKIHRAGAAFDSFVSVADLLGGLTARQANAIVAAHDSGYYREPRRTTLAQVADRHGLRRSTFEEHLRRGENRLMRALVPVLSPHKVRLPWRRLDRHA